MPIPKTIYLCNKILCEKTIQYANVWKELNPEYAIQVYDNEMCAKFLHDHYGELYRDIFEYIKDGPIKADFWRVCILYKYGGVYSDIDNQPLVPFSDFVEPDIDLLTCSAYMGGMKFNPNLIMTDKANHILEKCIEWYVKKYTNGDSYAYWEWSIMRAFTETLILEGYNLKYGLYKNDEQTVQILQECPGTFHGDAHNIYRDMRIFNNRYSTWNCATHSF
jgi:mannosyltransferase OCH1-like enzyme